MRTQAIKTPLGRYATEGPKLNSHKGIFKQNVHKRIFRQNSIHGNPFMKILFENAVMDFSFENPFRTISMSEHLIGQTNAGLPPEIWRREGVLSLSSSCAQSDAARTRSAPMSCNTTSRLRSMSNSCCLPAGHRRSGAQNRNRLHIRSKGKIVRFSCIF